MIDKPIYIASACGFTLNRQGLLAGLMAMVPGLAGKPLETVENACASVCTVLERAA